MGSVFGAALAFFVLDRFEGAKAVVASTVISVVLLGIACDYLCLSLGIHFRYWGSADHPGIFVAGSLLFSLVNGAAAGGLCFTGRGRSILRHVGA